MTSIITQLSEVARGVAATARPAVVRVEGGWRPASGVVVADGTILTNAHNVHGDAVAVTFADGRTVGMYDDNTTPRWAFFWAHGIPETAHPSNRTFAHVWEGADNIGAYTHLANLVMVPEPFASLTDKDGPLTGFLRWHAWTVYRWKPASAAAPRATAPASCSNSSAVPD